MVVGKKTAAGVLEIKHADHFIFVDKRSGQFGASFGIERDIARVFFYIGHQDGMFMLCGIPYNSGAESYVMLQLNILLKAQREAVLQLFSGRVEQQDAEHLVIDQPAEQFGDALEQFVKIQDRG